MRRSIGVVCGDRPAEVVERGDECTAVKFGGADRSPDQRLVLGLTSTPETLAVRAGHSADPTTGAVRSPPSRVSVRCMFVVTNS